LKPSWNACATATVIVVTAFREVLWVGCCAVFIQTTPRSAVNSLFPTLDAARDLCYKRPRTTVSSMAQTFRCSTYAYSWSFAFAWRFS
jgi:hypothetical protein